MADKQPRRNKKNFRPTEKSGAGMTRELGSRSIEL